ncbi:hypothetical protein FEM48_Zijuj09G0077000 [Ziziphus jujuba var. spinosa]|nr:hypothetical protein FEM48_Zijuj09G0077000 [Ziziphus jujuba var. spinosa]
MEGGGGRLSSDRRRVTLLDQMSAAADSRDLAGLTLDDVLGTEKRPVPAPPPAPPRSQSGRTLLDIIRDEEPKSGTFKGFSNRDKKAWKSFKDRLRLKRAGNAWNSSAPIPASDIRILNHRSLLLRHNSVNFHTASLPTVSRHNMAYPNENPVDIPAVGDMMAPPNNGRPQISRRGSTRFGAFSSDNSDDDVLAGQNTTRPQISRRHSVRFALSSDDNVGDQTDPPQREGSRRLSAALADERSLSAREAVAAQEAAEAEAAAAAAAAEQEAEDEDGESAPEGGEGGQPVRMSLMDLLEETDRQMGLVGSRYMMGDEDDYDEEEEEDEEDEEEESNGVEHNCCVCMVRHKGAAFIPCGHTFCRLCSRELWVSRGNCPLCNGFILEILDIF